jgi:hypothetical protein
VGVDGMRTQVTDLGYRVRVEDENTKQKSVAHICDVGLRGMGTQVTDLGYRSRVETGI